MSFEDKRKIEAQTDFVKRLEVQLKIERSKLTSLEHLFWSQHKIEIPEKCWIVVECNSYYNVRNIKGCYLSYEHALKNKPDDIITGEKKTFIFKVEEIQTKNLNYIWREELRDKVENKIWKDLN